MAKPEDQQVKDEFAGASGQAGGSEHESPLDTSSQPSKRQRVSRACLQCRTRKIKCTGESPNCAACRATGQNCSYGEAKRRGLPPGYLQQLEKYVKRLETIVGTICHHNSVDICASAIISPAPNAVGIWQDTDVYQILRNKEDINFDELLLKQCDSSSFKVSAPSSERISPKDQQRDPHRLRTQSSQSVAPSSSSMLTAGCTDENPAIYPTSASSDIRVLVPSPEVILGPTAGIDLSPNLPLLGFGPSKGGGSAIGDIHSYVTSISVSNKIAALDKYFASVHAWLPMVRKVDLLREAYEANFDCTGPQLLLWSAIYLCNVGSVGSNMVQSPPTDNNFMNSLFELTMAVANTVEGVQALVIQTLYFCGDNNWHRAWQAIGVAVRLASELGLHTYINRTWKACCVVETWVASRFGKVPYINSSTYDSRHLDEEAPEEWDMWRPLMLAPKNGLDSRGLSAQMHIPQLNTQPSHGISIFNALVDLTAILNTVVVEVNNPSFANKPRSHKSMLFSEIASQFQMWGRALPQHCSLSALAFSQTPMLPHKLNLYMAFTSTASLLYLFDEAHQYHISFSEDVLPVLGADLMQNFSTMYRPQPEGDSMNQDHFNKGQRVSGVPRTYPFFEYYMSLATSLALKLPSIDPRKLRFLANYVENSAPSISSQYFTALRFPALRVSANKSGGGHEGHNSLTNVLHEFATAASIQAGIEGGRRQLTTNSHSSLFNGNNNNNNNNNNAQRGVNRQTSPQKEQGRSSSASSSSTNQKEMAAVAFGLDQLEGEPMFDNTPIPHMEIPEFLHNLGFLDHP